MTTTAAAVAGSDSWWSPASTAHSALLYLALLFLLCHTHCMQRRHRVRRRNSSFNYAVFTLLHNHNAFWLVTITILLLHVATMVAIWLGGSSPKLLLAPGLGLLAVSTGGLVHRVVESTGGHPAWLTPLLAYYAVLGVIMLLEWGRDEIARGVLAQLGVSLGVAGLLQGAILLISILRGRRRTGREGGGGCGVEDEGGGRDWDTHYDDDDPTTKEIYAHDRAPLLSRLTFFWFTKLLRVGYSTPLEESHLGRLPHRHGTANQLARFRKAREAGRKLFWPLLWTVVGPNMALGGVFRLLADLAGFIAPLGIKTIVNWSGRNRTIFNVSLVSIDEEEMSPLTASQFIGNGYVMVGIVLMSSILQATFSQISTYLVNTEGLHVKVALQGLIYEKCLRVAGRGEETANLVGEDANNVMMLFWMAHFVWAIPLKLGVLMALLWVTLGWSALVAAALCIVIMIPLQFLIARAMAANSKLLLERSDVRLGWMGEMVANMRLLKTHAWEHLFGTRLKEIRGRELKHLDNDLLYRSIMTFLTHISTVVVTVVTFGLYPIMEEERLAPAAVFAGLAFFNQLTVPLFIFPLLVPVLIDARVSGRRIAEFLSLPEMHSDDISSGVVETETSKKCPSNQLLAAPAVATTASQLQGSTDSVFVLENIAEDEEEDDQHHQQENKEHANGVSSGVGNGGADAEWVVRLEEASFSWGGEEATNSPPALGKVSFVVRKERLTVIVGPTGSGKSSILSALLGELTLTEGSLQWTKGHRCGIAYAAQSPWILNGSVRENILFGHGFKGRRYKRVLEAVSLQQDLDLLPEGDATEIGDHAGIGLSGGQRQRIAIARALYSTAPLVILDDPLSALDVEVATHVLNVGIRKLLAKRTVVLVSHHLPVLHHAHHIVVMESGRIRIQGSLAEIRDRDPPLASHWAELISKKEAELARHMEAKTAKDRWTLLKLVSKFGFGARRPIQQDADTRGSQHHFRSRKGTFSTYKNLSHDFFLPSDEYHDELLTPILRRRHLSRASRESRGSASSAPRHGHVPLMRMSSLQPILATSGAAGGGGDRDKEYNRLRSMPANNDGEPLPPPISPRKFRSDYNRLHASSSTHYEPFFKRLFTNRKRTTSSSGSTELETQKPPSSPPPPPPSPRPVMGSIQSEGELTEDDPQERDELIGGSVEEREYGSVPLRIYLIYAKACGHALSGSYLLFAIGYEVVRVLTSFWLSRWSDSVAQEEEESSYEDQMSHFFIGYVLLSVATVGVSLTCNLLGAAAGARSRRILHDNFVFRLVDAPLNFFESTPIGRILGRASADVAVVDRKLVISVQRCLQFVFLCLSAVIVNGIVNPWFLLLALPLVAVYYAIQRFYRVSSRELQRLQAISRGPILSHFHETLSGISTIRAYGRQSVFTDHMWACIDLNNRADMFINVGNRWLSISLDYLGSIIVAVASVGAVISADLGLVTPSVVGLAINYTLLVPVYLNWVVKFLAEVEMFMNSVDRLDRYSELETEQLTGPENPPTSWPSKGDIDFEKLTISFQDNTVLSSLSLGIKGGEKVGLCGRSGSGKSTLLSSLFRLSGKMEGAIRIDGVDISRIPLRRLRSALCIIPQHSVLFTAPLRFNLDPANAVSEEDLWKALELAQMKETIQGLPHKLDQVMNPDSFSAGQRQLIALAVAVLHPSRVVILDEATSSVDADTEQVLLRAVATAFPDSTVLSIAHRLGTIVDGDRVVVLEEGKVVEDGSPSQLLARKTRSIFANMLRAEVSSAATGGGP